MSKNETICINGYEHLLYRQPTAYTEAEMLQRSKFFYEWLDKRRSVRTFSDKPVPKDVIENLLLSASTAPSGANKQPWTFCAVSNAALKSKIREAAEAEEKLSYESRMSEQWKNDLAHLGTNMHKPFLETAPWLIIVFKKNFDFDKNGGKLPNYYVNESVGIACGLLITAIHNAGLATLPYTPGPMNFLNKILERPSNERVYIVLPVGYAHDKTYVPDIHRKKIDQFVFFYE